LVASICADHDHRLLVAHQAAEEISYNFQQTVLLRQQVLTTGSLVIFTDAGAAIDPDAADISAHRARCNATLGLLRMRFTFAARALE